MKYVKFRPLMVQKSTGKIIVAGYAQWRKFWLTRYDKPNVDIVIDSNYDESAYVFNHKGEQLFWRKNIMPDVLPKRHRRDYNRILATVGIWEPMGESESGFEGYVDGLDCDGIPTFSHGTSKYIASTRNELEEWEPLTVGIINIWFGYILWRFNSHSIETI